MKKILCILIVIGIWETGISQNGLIISTDNSDVNKSAMLEVKSKVKGVLIPRMTQSERESIKSPANALLVYQTDNKSGFYYFTDNKWVRISSDEQTIPSVYKTTANSETENHSAPFITLDKDMIIFNGISLKVLNADIDIMDGKISSASNLIAKSGNFSGNVTSDGDITTKTEVNAPKGNFSEGIVTEGDIKLGSKNSECTSANAGSIRYNPTEGCIEYCHNNEWSCMGSGDDPCGDIPNPRPEIEIYGSAKDKNCFTNGDNIVLSAKMLNEWNAANYSWSGPNGFTHNSKSTDIITLSTNSSGEYTATVSHPDIPACNHKAKFNLIVNPEINISSISAENFCGNNAGYIKTEVTGEKLTINWQILNGDSWEKLNISANYTLENDNKTLKIANGEGLSGKQYRVVVSGQCGEEAKTSEAITLQYSEHCILSSCKEILNMGISKGDGIYTIDPDGADNGMAEFEVYCDMTSDGGGWTICAGFDPYESGTTGTLKATYFTSSHGSIDNLNKVGLTWGVNCADLKNKISATRIIFKSENDWWSVDSPASLDNFRSKAQYNTGKLNESVSNVSTNTPLKDISVDWDGSCTYGSAGHQWHILGKTKPDCNKPLTSGIGYRITGSSNPELVACGYNISGSSCKNRWIFMGIK